MVATLCMTGQRAQNPAEPAAHPLRAALARGDRAHARSAPALQHLLAAPDQSLIEEAVVAQVRGMLGDLSRQLVETRSRSVPIDAAAHEAMHGRLLLEGDLRAHCQALALEWRLARRLESELAIDPVLSPLIQGWVAEADAATGSLAMAALAAQARFAQGQRRMQLPLAELSAELFHAVLAAAREAIPDAAVDEARLRADYEEAASRLALFARLAREAGSQTVRALNVEDAGVALWLSALAARSGESRDRTACAAADPHLGRLLLTLRAAGAMPAEAERQALCVQPDAELPRGLEDIGTREAAQWLAEGQS
jgi:hypothetical protein